MKLSLHAIHYIYVKLITEPIYKINTLSVLFTCAPWATRISITFKRFLWWLQFRLLNFLLAIINAVFPFYVLYIRWGWIRITKMSSRDKDITFWFILISAPYARRVATTSKLPSYEARIKAVNLFYNNINMFPITATDLIVLRKSVWFNRVYLVSNIDICSIFNETSYYCRVTVFWGNHQYRPSILLILYIVRIIAV